METIKTVEFDLIQISLLVWEYLYSFTLADVRWWPKAFSFHLLHLELNDFDAYLIAIVWRGDWEQYKMFHCWFLAGLFDFAIGRKHLEVGLLDSRWGFQFNFQTRKFYPLIEE